MSSDFGYSKYIFKLAFFSFLFDCSFYTVFSDILFLLLNLKFELLGKTISLPFRASLLRLHPPFLPQQRQRQRQTDGESSARDELSLEGEKPKEVEMRKGKEGVLKVLCTCQFSCPFLLISCAFYKFQFMVNIVHVGLCHLKQMYLILNSMFNVLKIHIFCEHSLTTFAL